MSKVCTFSFSDMARIQLLSILYKNVILILTVEIKMVGRHYTGLASMTMLIKEISAIIKF